MSTGGGGTRRGDRGHSAEESASSGAFGSVLVVRTEKHKENKLPNTSEILHISKPFSTTSCQRCIVAFSETAIEIYNVSPFSIIKEIPYRQEIDEIVSIGNVLVLKNTSKISFFCRDQYHFIEDKTVGYARRKLLGILAGNTVKVGVQGEAALEVYDTNGAKENIFRCQCSWAARDLLLLGDGTHLRVFYKGEEQAEIFLPERICCIAADPLFTRIFCACEGGRIYSVSLCGKGTRVLEYYDKTVTSMCISFCGQYLYTCDGNLLCIWCLRKGVVIGRTGYESTVSDIRVLLSGERKQVDIPDSIARAFSL